MGVARLLLPGLALLLLTRAAALTGLPGARRGGLLLLLLSWTLWAAGLLLVLLTRLVRVAGVAWILTRVWRCHGVLLDVSGFSGMRPLNFYYRRTKGADRVGPMEK